MNRDQIKYIAMFTMLLNHVANIFLEPGTLLFEVMVDIGYFTAITMCYFLVEGYRYTHSKEKYGKRLLWFAMISEIPFCLAFTEEGIISFVSMNMIFTLFLCFLILYVREKFPVGTRQTLGIWGLVLVSAYSDWAILVPIFTWWFAECRDGMMPSGAIEGKISDSMPEKEQRKKLWRVFGKAMLLFGLLSFVENIQTDAPFISLIRALGAVLGIYLSGICIIYLYNGRRAEKGRNFSKWFFYVFYPAHLLVLGILRVKRLNLG